MRYINMAIEEALLSTMNIKHGSVIVNKGRYIGKGYNSERSYVRGDIIPSNHAERAAICSLHPKHIKQRVLWGYNLYY